MRVFEKVANAKPLLLRLTAGVGWTITSVAGLSSPAAAYSGEIYTVCRLNPQGDNFLALRDCGSTKCPAIKRLGPGTFLWTLEPYSNGGWRPVTVMRDINDEYPIKGPTGYVFDRYICKVDMTE